MCLLDSRIKSIINELDVKVKYSDKLDADGHYIATINTIVIKKSLSDQNKILALLHELGHAAKHKENHKMYNLAFSLHSKMENEAEEFMLEKILEIRMNDSEFDPVTFNYVNFLESYKLDLNYESTVKELMTNYYLNTRIV